MVPWDSCVGFLLLPVPWSHKYTDDVGALPQKAVVEQICPLLNDKREQGMTGSSECWLIKAVEQLSRIADKTILHKFVSSARF